MTARKFIHAPEPATPEQIARLVAVICARVPQGWQKIAHRVRAALGASDDAIKAAIWQGVERGLFAVKLVACTGSPLVPGGSLVGARVSVIERIPAPEPQSARRALPPLGPISDHVEPIDHSRPVAAPRADVFERGEYRPDAAMRDQIARCRRVHPVTVPGSMAAHQPAAVLDGRTA